MLRRTISALATSLALAAAACGGPPARDDEIVLLNEAPVARIDPRYALASWEMRVSHLVAPGLIDLAERGLGPTRGLAESIVREGDEARSYVATLRQGLRFSDGSPVTSADVKYTFDSVLDPKLGSPYRKTWEQRLAAVEVIDERTVRFRLREPRADFNIDFGIVSRRHAEPLDALVRDAVTAGRRPPPFAPAREVVGAGPYKLESRSADAVTFVRNPFAEQPPATERFTVRTIRDDNSRVLALVGGSADAILNGGTPIVFETLEDNPKVSVLYGRSATISYIGFNNDDRILKDVRVRRAIALAIDRERLVAAKLRGKAQVASSPIDAQNPFFAPGLRAWSYDPAAAKRLLDEAGFPDPDGDGPLPRFELTWKSSAMRFRVSLAQAMARQLADVGIAVDVRPFEFATFLDDVKKGNFQLFTLQLTDVVEPDMLFPLLHSTRIPSAANSWGGQNRFRFRSGELDRLLERGARETNPEKSRAIYAEAQRIIAEALPLLPLWHEDNVLAVSRRLTGVTAPLKTGRLETFLAARKLPEEARR
jgi:peptide/nickel transport system substrate-binding protein